MSVYYFIISRKNTNFSYADSVDPDPTPRLAASDLGLHYCNCYFYGALDINGLNCQK